MAVGPNEMLIGVSPDQADRRSAPSRAELVSSSEANIRKTVTSEQVTSKAGKTHNEYDLTRKTTQES